MLCFEKPKMFDEKCIFFLSSSVLTSSTCEDGDSLFFSPQVDPMFHKMASSFDESSTAGVFLSVLFSENSRCELLFPSYMTLLQSRPSYSPPLAQTVPASPFMGGKYFIWPKTSGTSFTSICRLRTVSGPSCLASAVQESTWY